MKKFLAAILAILYLSTTIGATIHMHYCMGRLVDWGLTHSNSSTCARCGMEKKSGSFNGCCKDECKQLRVDKDQKINESDIKLNGAITEITLINFSDQSISYPLTSPVCSTNINSPPLCRHTSLNIFNCVFRI